MIFFRLQKQQNNSFSPQIVLRPTHLLSSLLLSPPPLLLPSYATTDAMMKVDTSQQSSSSASTSEAPSPTTAAVRLGKGPTVGPSSFETVIKDESAFVDKSLFIEEVLSEGSKYILILRPRRFGKSIALSMLNSFFNINGAVENRALFNGLQIEKEHPEVFASEGSFGRHPVISLNLKVWLSPSHSTLWTDWFPCFNRKLSAEVGNACLAVFVICSLRCIMSSVTCLSLRFSENTKRPFFAASRKQMKR